MDIELKNGVIRYYGNPAGYIAEDKAVVDRLFAGAELRNWLERRQLTPEWTDGVYDRLVAHSAAGPDEAVPPIRSCRVWQLKDDMDPLMKFICLTETRERFGEPEPDHYRLAYDGQVATSDLEEIWDLFNTSVPPGFKGHALSISDVVELYDSAGSEYFYVDRYGFAKIAFGGEEQAQGFQLEMGL